MSFIQKHWSTIGGVIGVGTILILLALDTDFDTFQPWLIVHIAILMLHQFEEYSFPGGFKKYFNKYIVTTHPLIRQELSDRAVIMINIILGWGLFALSVLIYEHAIWFAFGLIIISLINGIVHLSLSLFKQSYCPGLVSSLILFIPFGSFMFYNFGKLLNPLDLLLSLLFGIIGSFSLVIIINKSKKEPAS